MYELFDDYDIRERGRYLFPEFDVTRRTYLRDLGMVLSYFRNRVFFVDNQHILVQMLNTGYVPVDYDIDRYASVASTRAPYLANHFKLTSERTYGAFGNGDFFGKNNTEILLFNESAFSPFKAMENWQDLEPVTVLEHPFCELSLVPPSGKTNSHISGLVTINIDIPMLLVQYRGFILDQRKKHLENGEDMLDATHFVHMYVLPNMLRSMLDITLVNRLQNLYYQREVYDAPIRKLPIVIVDYSSRIDATMTRVISRIENKSMLYSNVVKNIPSIVASDMLERLQMPDLAKTRQVWWALLISRWSMMMFLIRVCGEEAVAYNTNLIAKMKVIIKRMRSDNVFKQMLPKEMYDKVASDMSEIERL